MAMEKFASKLAPEQNKAKNCKNKVQLLIHK